MSEQDVSDRLPPQNIEAEQSTLGSILLDAEVMHEIAPFLRVDDFFRDSHQTIYAAIGSLYQDGKGIDGVTVANILRQRGQFESAGGDDTLTEIVERVPHSANAKYYAEIVKEKSIHRHLIEAAKKIIKDGYSNQLTAQQSLDGAERKIFMIAQDQLREQPFEIREVLAKAMDQIQARATDGHSVIGLESGFVGLDQITGGFQPGQLIVLAARPSIGKTALALNICEDVTVRSGKSAFFISLEMNQFEVADRLLLRDRASMAISCGLERASTIGLRRVWRGRTTS